MERGEKKKSTAQQQHKSTTQIPKQQRTPKENKTNSNCATRKTKKDKEGQKIKSNRGKIYTN